MSLFLYYPSLLDITFTLVEEVAGFTNVLNVHVAYSDMYKTKSFDLIDKQRHRVKINENVMRETSKPIVMIVLHREKLNQCYKAPITSRLS